MYSLVLMTAMTAAPDTASEGFFRNLFHGCNGCNGCMGAARYSCGGCGGCNGCCGGCNGCCGGFLGLGLFSQRSSYGCCGGCSGVSYGCGSTSHACYGSTAYSCYGGPVVSYTPTFNGALGCYGGPLPSAPPPVYGTPNIPYATPEAAPGFSGFRQVGYGDAPGVTTSANPGARATVVIRVPADARLFADNTALRMTGPERKFVTPELPAGMEYTYRFRAEYDRDGETISVSRRVTVRAGGSVAVEFNDLVAGKGGPTATPVSNPTPAAPSVAPSVAPEVPNVAPTPTAPGGDRATITVKLPPGAALYVDDRRNPSLDPVRQFSTPPLPAGREFAYLMKAEVVRDGRPEYLIQKVPFRAGERVTVDFTALGMR